MYVVQHTCWHKNLDSISELW